MKCPLCKKHIDYPTQGQFLAWFYRYVYEYSEEDAAKILGITPRSVRSRLQRLKEIWPGFIPIPRRKEVSLREFNEEMHSQHHKF